jgi:hypothetical protein
VTSRNVRIVAVALPALLVCVLVVSGGWRIHGGLVERVGHVPAGASTPAVPGAASPVVATPATDETSFVRHLSPSVPWPAWAGLVVLCLLPAVASMTAWSGARRARDSGSFVVQGGS